MLTQEIRELIARSIDDGLSPAERKCLEVALRENESARRFHARLKQDSKSLRALPAVKPGVDIAAAVSRMIQDRDLTPTPVPPQPKRSLPKRSPVRQRIGLATAAGIMFAITATSFIYFSMTARSVQRINESSVARDTTRKGRSMPDRQTLPVQVNSDDPIGESVPEAIVKAPTPISLTPEQGPAPRVVDDSILTARPEAMPEIHSINIAKHRVSRFLNLTDLASVDSAQVKNQAEIRNELKADELIRLDLFCRDTRSAMDLMTAALKARGTQTVVDQHLVDRIKKRQTTEIVLFTDVLTPEEVFQLLGEMARNEMNAGDTKGEFDTLVVAPFLPADLDMLGRILGAGSAISKMPKSKTPIDIRKPLPEGTANHLAQSLSKMGNGTGSVATPAKAKIEKLAFVGSYTPVNPAPLQSKEIKSFLERRADKRPDAKPLMLVLRTLN